MHSRFLREVAKVGVGLFIADLVSAVWFGAAGFLPLTILGVTWTASAVLPIVVFDLALIILLAHFGWNTNVPVRSPSEKGLLLVAGLVFLVVALAHLSRIAFGWSLVLDEYPVPLWLSWLGTFAAGYLSYSSFHFAHRLGRK